MMFPLLTVIAAGVLGLIIGALIVSNVPPNETEFTQVENINPAPRARCTYFYIRAKISTSEEVNDYLFTEEQLGNAKYRAGRNPEDFKHI